MIQSLDKWWLVQTILKIKISPILVIICINWIIEISTTWPENKIFPSGFHNFYYWNRANVAPSSQRRVHHVNKFLIFSGNTWQYFVSRVTNDIIDKLNLQKSKHYTFFFAGKKWDWKLCRSSSFWAFCSFPPSSTLFGWWRVVDNLWFHLVLW